MAVLKNVIVNWVKIKRPDLDYQEDEVEGVPLGNRSYTLDATLTDADYDRLEDKFSHIKSVQIIKQYTPAKYKERFKVDGPEGEEYLSPKGKYSVMKLSQKCAIPDGKGNPFGKEPEVKVLGVNNAKNRDQDGELVGPDIEMSNGSEANIQFRVRKYKNPKNGTSGESIDLVAVQVIKLIPYEGGEVEDEFGYDAAAEGDDSFGDGDDFADSSDGDSDKDNSDTGPAKGAAVPPKDKW